MSTVQRVKNYESPSLPFEVRGILDAALSADWRQALVARGYGWHADEGSFSTPAAGGGAAAIIDIDRPNLLVSVPADYTLVPLRIHCVAQMPLGATDSDESEIVIAVDPSLAATGITTQTTRVVPINMRSTSVANSLVCPFLVYKTLSGDLTTAPTLSYELGHAVKIFETKTDVGTTWADLELLYEPANAPFFRGPCALYVYHGGTVATTGFTNADFLAIPSSLIDDLV